MDQSEARDHMRPASTSARWRRALHSLFSSRLPALSPRMGSGETLVTFRGVQCFGCLRLGAPHATPTTLLRQYFQLSLQLQPPGPSRTAKMLARSPTTAWHGVLYGALLHPVLARDGSRPGSRRQRCVCQGPLFHSPCCLRLWGPADTTEGVGPHPPQETAAARA